MYIAYRTVYSDGSASLRSIFYTSVVSLDLVQS